MVSLQHYQITRQKLGLYLGLKKHVFIFKFIPVYESIYAVLIGICIV